MDDRLGQLDVRGIATDEVVTAADHEPLERAERDDRAGEDDVRPGDAPGHVPTGAGPADRG
ncbi:MAG TPA: hypothetical protein VMW19_06245 [Myxococcota bacterium]|nr:hypothetical protein [Myxococcota bacterium]